MKLLIPEPGVGRVFLILSKVVGGGVSLGLALFPGWRERRIKFATTPKQVGVYATYVEFSVPV